MRLSICLAVAIVCFASAFARAADDVPSPAQIKSAIDENDKQHLSWWANYLDQTWGLTRMAQWCRAAEARIRAERKQERDAECLS